MELYRIHRPPNFKQIIGNEDTKRKLLSIASQPAGKRPQSYLFVGQPGCGKTTFAYILARKFGCKYPKELNTGSFRGIDTARDLGRQMQYKAPGGDDCLVFIIEEAHRLTAEAMDALLKPLENCPGHVYFMFTTTNPEKITAALKQRMFTIQVEPLSEEQLVVILRNAITTEKKEISDKVLEKIAKLAQSSARRAFMILEGVINLPPEEMYEGVKAVADTETFAIDLCRALMNPKATWKDVAPMLKDLKEDPESVRRMVLGYMNSVLVKSGNKRGYLIMTAFASNYYDTGRSGLSMSVYEALQAE
jgi:DNA polymerase-3 subunit gamma/tau